MAALSLLSVCSRHHRHASHNSILIHNSTTLSRHMPAPTEHHIRAFGRGTRVMVRDLFGSMPVRVKQRVTATSERFRLEKEWMQLVIDIVAILLAWPSDVSVSLSEKTSQREVRLNPAETSDITARTSRLLTKASLSDLADSDDWVPLSAVAGTVSVKGCISSNPVATRRYQFISIGIHPMSNEHGTNVIYEEINKIFATSSFGAFEEEPDQESRVLSNKDVKNRKGVERWPMFYFRLKLHNSSSYDLDGRLDDRSREFAAITDLLRAVCYGFLKKHHHLPQKISLSSEQSVFSTSRTLGHAKVTPLKRPLSAIDPTRPPGSSVHDRIHRSESPFDGWRRVKVGYPTKKQPKPLASDKERIVGKGGVLLRKPFEDVVESGALEMSSPHFAPSTPTIPEDEMTTTMKTPESVNQSALRTSLVKRPKVEPQGWLKEILQKWDNPVFEDAPLAVPRTYHDAPPLIAESRANARSNYFNIATEDCGIMFESNSVNINGRISKAALMDAEVISQVDLKFILVKLRLESVARDSVEEADSAALVVLDQHAVDERIRLEELMSKYFVLQPDGSLSAETECLEQPLKYEVQGQDAELLVMFQAHLSTWGIVFSIDSSSRSETRHTIRVTHLPSSITQRCLTEPDLLIALIRNETYRHERPPLPPTRDDSQHPWVSYFHDCPLGILELLHSRSCRSAVMFNDVLTRDECETMLRRVAGCAFPFQCAHGRPSMAPLIDLGAGRMAGESEATGIDWNSWMEGG